jgi:serine acetyltransferase
VLNATAMALPRVLQHLVSQFMADARFYAGLRRGTHSGAGLVSTLARSRGLWMLTSHRVAHFCMRQRGVRRPVWLIARLCKSVGVGFNVLYCRSQVAEDCEIAGPTYLSNRGYVFCGALSIGAGSLIHDHCTIGQTVARGEAGRPRIGRNVWIGPDCVIAGPVAVGDGATVLPGSVITFSVPPGAVVKGNPGRIVRADFDNSALRRSLLIFADLPVETHDT